MRAFGCVMEQRYRRAPINRSQDRSRQESCDGGNRRHNPERPPENVPESFSCGPRRSYPENRQQNRTAQEQHDRTQRCGNRYLVEVCDQHLDPDKTQHTREADGQDELRPTEPRWLPLSDMRSKLLRPGYIDRSATAALLPLSLASRNPPLE